MTDEKVEAALLRIRGADFIRRREARVYEVASQSVLMARVVFAALGSHLGRAQEYADSAIY